MSRAHAGAEGADAPVVELDSIRRLRRRDKLLADLARAQDDHRRTVARLIHSNLIWTRRGARAGRLLLANWERLVDETDRLRRLELPPPLDGAPADLLFATVESLLAKSERLASRSAELVTQSR